MIANKKERFEPFDFYRTEMGDCIWGNINEKFLKLSDYGITEQDVHEYVQMINLQREEAAERHIIYEHRCNFFKVLAALFLIWVFFFIVFFIVEYFNDFVEEYGVLFHILCYPVYIGLIWGLYKYPYLFLVFIMESVQERIEQAHKYPDNGHPEFYDPRIEKYFNDLLWKLTEHKGFTSS